MSGRMFGVLCESDKGLDVFGNAKGVPILMESTGEGIENYHAVKRAEELNASGRYGRAVVVELEVVEGMFTGGAK